MKDVMETIKAARVPRRYAMRSQDLDAVRDAAAGSVYKMMCYAFNYGFLKGQRAEKVAQEEKRKKAAA